MPRPEKGREAEELRAKKHRPRALILRKVTASPKVQLVPLVGAAKPDA
jgi:hypothetical protein